MQQLAFRFLDTQTYKISDRHIKSKTDFDILKILTE